MWRRQSTLVLLTVAVMAISGQDPVILDLNHTEEVKVPLGSKLIFKCDFNTAEHERFVVDWYFNRSGPSYSATDHISKQHFNRSTHSSFRETLQHSENIKVLIHTSNATEENSGWYSCKVTADIPVLWNPKSKGRFVNITTVSPEDSGLPTDWGLWIALGVSTAILAVLLVICILLRRRYRSSREEDPIYVNTHPRQPSPRPVGHLKAASSSQSLQKPNKNPGKSFDRGKQRYR
ncbi:uncharacterized protein V6R79_008066 [Siganus canaliculatus]